LARLTNDQILILGIDFGCVMFAGFGVGRFVADFVLQAHLVGDFGANLL
jgi:hypothetical protein